MAVLVKGPKLLPSSPPSHADHGVGARRRPTIATCSLDVSSDESSVELAPWMRTSMVIMVPSMEAFLADVEIARVRRGTGRALRFTGVVCQLSARARAQTL